VHFRPRVRVPEDWRWPVGVGLSVSPQAKISYDLTKVVSPGIEYYGGLGPIGNFLPSSQQQQLLFAVVDLNFDPKWNSTSGSAWG
jgi:hypothetical protein